MEFNQKLYLLHLLSEKKEEKDMVEYYWMPLATRLEREEGAGDGF